MQNLSTYSGSQPVRQGHRVHLPVAALSWMISSSALILPRKSSPWDVIPRRRASTAAMTSSATFARRDARGSVGGEGLRGERGAAGTVGTAAGEAGEAEVAATADCVDVEACALLSIMYGVAFGSAVQVVWCNRILVGGRYGCVIVLKLQEEGRVVYCLDSVAAVCCCCVLSMARHPPHTVLSPRARAGLTSVES